MGFKQMISEYFNISSTRVSNLNTFTFHLYLQAKYKLSNQKIPINLMSKATKLKKKHVTSSIDRRTPQILGTCFRSLQLNRAYLTQNLSTC